MCREESAFHRNQFVKDIVWEVTDISKVAAKLEPNQSICSPSFCAQGIRDMLFEYLLVKRQLFGSNNFMSLLFDPKFQ